VGHSVGEVARLAGITVSTLHLYDDVREAVHANADRAEAG